MRLYLCNFKVSIKLKFNYSAIVSVDADPEKYPKTGNDPISCHLMNPTVAMNMVKMLSQKG
jgi:hypothetical protein